MSIKLNLHSHTEGSPDSVTKISKLGELFEKGIVDQIAITDHDSIEYALKALTMYGPERIIPGIEIRTDKDKDVIALFVEGFIEPNRPALEIAKEIKEKGGIVYIPNPFEPRRGLGQEELDILENEGVIDIIEGFNSWVYPSFLNPKGKKCQNEEAWIYARKNDIPVVSSSDAHTIKDFKNAYTTVPKIVTKENILEVLKSDDVTYKRTFSKPNFIIVSIIPKFTRHALKKMFTKLAGKVRIRK